MKFEEYIRKIRPLMDADQPDEDLIWVGISQSLENHAKRKRIQHWKIALMAAAMVVIAFAAGLHVAKKNYILIIDPEFTQQRIEMVNLIENYTHQLKRTNFDLETLPTTPAELKYIDKLIVAYSADLKQYGASPELLETLLDLYGKKIMLLNRMLNEIKKIKEYENNMFF